MARLRLLGTTSMFDGQRKFPLLWYTILFISCSIGIGGNVQIII